MVQDFSHQQYVEEVIGHPLLIIWEYDDWFPGLNLCKTNRNSFKGNLLGREICGERFMKLYPLPGSKENREGTHYLRSGVSFLCNSLWNQWIALHEVLCVFKDIHTYYIHIDIYIYIEIESQQLTQSSSSWWFQPIWKILVKMDHFPNFRGEHRTYLKPPVRNQILIPKNWIFFGDSLTKPHFWGMSCHHLVFTLPVLGSGKPLWSFPCAPGDAIAAINMPHVTMENIKWGNGMNICYRVFCCTKIMESNFCIFLFENTYQCNFLAT